MEDLCVLSDSICFNDTISIYEVRCDIIILENDTLRIDAGENIKLFVLYLPYSAILYGFTIYGRVIALGDEINPIFIGDIEFDFWNGEFWRGFMFCDNSPNNESILKYCLLRGAQAPVSESAIYCDNSSPIIEYCNISYIWSGMETGGGSGVYCAGNSHPIISYCIFETLLNSVAIWCGNEVESYFWGWQDTLSYPSPLVIGCNIMPSVGSFWGFGCDYDKVVLNGGFLDNCYLGINDLYADVTLGNPSDTIGDGICTTNSMNWDPKFWLIDGVVNPRSTPEMTDINEEEINISPTTSDYIVLNQNFPNPFNPKTNISFSIYHKTKVSLSVYNSKGQKVKSLFNSTKDKGIYSIIWDGKNEVNIPVSSGVYFYKLISDERVLKTKKMLLMR